MVGQAMVGQAVVRIRRSEEEPRTVAQLAATFEELSSVHTKGKADVTSASMSKTPVQEDGDVPDVPPAREAERADEEPQGVEDKVPSSAALQEAAGTPMERVKAAGAAKKRTEEDQRYLLQRRRRRVQQPPFGACHGSCVRGIKAGLTACFPFLLSFDHLLHLALSRCKKIFVQNVPTTLSKADFQSHLAVFGKVVKVELHSAKLFGFVTYDVEEAAHAAAAKPLPHGMKATLHIKRSDPGLPRSSSRKSARYARKP
ncbi:GLYK [Symbiodinium sp. CCMP2592]|nr:GLYK [Symbiodinium sp. CCMP2592]